MTRTMSGIVPRAGLKPYLELNEVDKAHFEALDKQGVGFMYGVPTTFCVINGQIRLWPVPEFKMKLRILLDDL